jgi:hypothetical protein
MLRLGEKQIPMSKVQGLKLASDVANSHNLLRGNSPEKIHQPLE